MGRPETVPDKLTPAKAVERLHDLRDNWSHDPEVMHAYADLILMAVLRRTVAGKAVADAFDELNPMWYA